MSSDAAASLSQMATRGAAGDPALAQLVRARQDLVVEWQGRDRVRSDSLSMLPEQRDRKTEAANLERLHEIDGLVQAIDDKLKVQFPDYAALSAPSPIDLSEVPAMLKPDEALVLILTTPEMKPVPEETFVWVVTTTALKWVRTDLGDHALQREVAALRCGLDYDGSWQIENSPCPTLLQTTYNEADRTAGRPLPFDLARAHALYKALFGQIENEIKDKHLLIVPTGPLTQLPFQVLVSAPPDPAATGADAMRKAAWLVRDHAISILPSVASLKALRKLAKGSRASRAMIGFGNPLLDGSGPGEATAALRARANTSCPVQMASLSFSHRGVPELRLRSGTADIHLIRAAPPLPETADELCAVAEDLKVGAGDIYLGARATVLEVQHLSDAGELQKYRLVHFATHGALAGQVGKNAEPGLILTPPKAASPEDDGYLSASRVAGLKLDADWVILSACNTAAGGASGAEALSGLARAFFYAGARALLVSHWSVNSIATVKLIAGAVGRMGADARLGRADALRRSILSLIEHGSDTEVQPAYWAPFVVVGEGAAVK
jgi:CHAT domain-containing protein